MKKIILVFAAIGITAGVYAQSDSTNKKMNHQEMNNAHHQNMHNNMVDNFHPDGVLMQNGEIKKVENGEMTILNEDMTMSNGTIVMTDGNYTEVDGTTKMLKEGQHIDMDGNLTFLKSNEDNNMYLVPDSTRKKDFQIHRTPPQF